MIRQLIHRMGALSLLIAATLFTGMASAETAHEAVQKVRNDLVEVIAKKASIEAEGGPDAYYEAVRGVFADVVDFGFIARGVMGNHAKDATPEQRQKFAETLEFSLMNTVTTYTRSLATEYEMEVVPPKGDVSGQRSISVIIEVRTAEEKNNLSFTMRKRDEDWKLSNLILNGINLGVTFRSQFAQAMKKNPDIEAVIADWSV